LFREQELQLSLPLAVVQAHPLGALLVQVVQVVGEQEVVVRVQETHPQQAHRKAIMVAQGLRLHPLLAVVVVVAHLLLAVRHQVLLLAMVVMELHLL
jgi:hypothetical protein